MARLTIFLLAAFVILFVNVNGLDIQKLVDQAKQSKNDPENRAFATINGREYFIGTELKLSWLDAIEFCNALAGPQSLVSLETPEENEAIKAYLGDNGMFGVEFWTSAQTLQTGGYLWTGSGQLGTYVDWAPGQPDLSQNHVCAQMSTSGWGDEQCGQKQYNYICELSE